MQPPLENAAIGVVGASRRSPPSSTTSMSPASSRARWTRSSLWIGTSPWSDTTSSTSRAGSRAPHSEATERSTERPIRLRPSRAASAEPDEYAHWSGATSRLACWYSSGVGW